MPTVLVIDDEANIRTTLGICLEAAGWQVTLAGTQDAALDHAEKQRFDLAFLDLRLGDNNGLDLMQKLLSLQPSLAVIIITAYPELGTAVDAISIGAVDYIPKPFTPEQIRRAADRFLPNRRTHESD